MGSSDNELWDAYNLLLLSSDTERIRKLLVRYELYRRTVEMPGDIVECGVFKGAGLFYWLKLLAIRNAGSAKRVVGFDTFDSFAETSDDHDAQSVAKFVEESAFYGADIEALYATADKFAPGQCELVKGNIVKTAPDYVRSNPGFRVSLLNLDLDLAEGTTAALEAFWPRMVRGGIIIFDEYSIGQWSESEAVDRFFKNQDIKFHSLPWGRTPTAFVVVP